MVAICSTTSGYHTRKTEKNGSLFSVKMINEILIERRMWQISCIKFSFKFTSSSSKAVYKEARIWMHYFRASPILEHGKNGKKTGVDLLYSSNGNFCCWQGPTTPSIQRQWWPWHRWIQLTFDSGLRRNGKRFDNDMALSINIDANLWPLTNSVPQIYKGFL